MKRRACDLLAFFAPLAVYLLTLVPTIHLGDSGELTVGAFMLAVPHVPGYPLLATLGHFFSWFPLAHAAWRGNLFSAFFGALAVWMTYRLLYELTGRRAVAFAVALAFAGTYTLWEQSLKIRAYPLNTFFAALVIWLSLRWRKTLDRRFIMSAFFLLGLGVSNHEILMVTAAVPVVFMIARRREIRARDFALAVTFLGLGLSVYLYVPLRAAAGPVLNWGEPNNLPRLLDALLQRQYAEKMLNADWTSKLQMLGLIARSFFDEGGLLMLMLGLGGLSLLAIKDRTLLVGLLLLVLLNIVLRINYIGTDEMFQVRRYLISSYLALMIGAGIALNEVARRLLARRQRAGSVVFALVALALMLSPWIRHARANDQSGNWVAYEAWQNALSHSEERYAIVVGGDNNLFPLWYLQMVERRRANVVALPRIGFRSPWIIHLLEPALPAGAIAMRPEYRRADLSDPLFLSTIANLIDLHSLPFAFVFDLVTDPADQRELAALRAKVQLSYEGALSWWRPKDQPGSPAHFDVWRFYQTSAILDTALVRDHHTETVATDYGVYFDRLASQLEQKGDFAGAVRAEENAIGADSNNDTAMANLGSMLARRGRITDAIAWYQRAIAVNPREWRHHFNLAIIYEAAGRVNEATDERRKAVTERRP